MLQKDLVLDLNPINQLVGTGPTVALVTSYASQPIVNEMKGLATGFPMTRSLEIKNTDKSSVQKLFDSSENSFATEDLATSRVKMDDPKNRKGPFTLAAAGSYSTGKENSQGRFVVIRQFGMDHKWIHQFQGQQRPCVEFSQLAFFRRRPDFDSSQARGRPPHQHDTGATSVAPRHQPVPAARNRSNRRHLRLAEKKINQGAPFLAAPFAREVGILTLFLADRKNETP